MYSLTALVALALDAAWGYPPSAFAAVGHPVSWIGRLIAWCEARWNSPALRSPGVAPRASARCSSCSWLPPRWRPAHRGHHALVPVAVQSRLDRRCGQHPHRPAQPERPCRRRRRCPGGRRHRSRREQRSRRSSAVIRARSTRPTSAAPPSKASPRTTPTASSRRCSGWSSAGCRAPVLQGHQHRRQHDRPQERALSRLRLGSGAPRRRRQPAGLALGGALPRRCRGAAAGARCAAALRAIARDARHHRSPNAGWPEAAMAGALGLRLAGPRVYARRRRRRPVDGRWPAAAGAADIRRALRLYRTACLLQALVVAALAVLIAM